ncbi:hypothetical protein ACFODL_08890 [Phenylobacterium terrae]|uniref:Valyl-tRNA synthetase tRNA-binding arm domain-containing protein n=1 Tax=Phenylobacterium terrae TaxID=2665495 RepID=A0ABW4N4U4_9CAUL
MFGMYVANRAFAGQGLGTSLLTPEGKDPKTVAEAIEVAGAHKAKLQRIEAIEAEKQAKDQVFLKRLEELKGPMEAAHYAPAPTQAYNAVIEERDAMLADYDKRIAALR